MTTVQVPDEFVRKMQERAEEIVALIRATSINEAEVLAILNAAWTWAFAQGYYPESSREAHLTLTLESMRDATIDMMNLLRGGGQNDGRDPSGSRGNH